MRNIYLLAGLTALSVIIAIAAGLVFSTGWAVAALEDEARTRLGRELTVAGGAHLEIAPALAMRFDTVDLAAASGLESSFVSAESLRIPLSLGDLLHHRLDGAYSLVNARVSLEISDSGDVSWAGPEKGPPEPATETFSFEGGSLNFFDHRNNQHFAVTDLDLAATLTPDGQLTVAGNGAIGGRLTRIDAFIKAVGRVNADGSPVDLALEAPSLQATFNGRLATANGLNLAGPVSVSGPDLRDAANWLGAPLAGSRGFGRYSLSGALESGGPDFTVKNTAIRIDDLAATGDFGLSFAGDTPQVLGKLGIESLDLAAYVAGPGLAGPQWSETPLAYDALRSLDARLSLDVAHLRFAGFDGGSAAIEASLAAGRLAIVMTGASLAGGTARTDFEFDGSGSQPVFSLHLEGQNLDMSRFLGGLAGLPFVAGPAALSLEVSGFGASTAAIASTLKGKASIAVGRGALAAIDVKALVAAVRERILDGWQSAPAATTPFATLAATFEITDGIATSKDLELSGDGLAVAGRGQVDLLRRALDLSLAPKLGTSGLPVPVIVKGPWAAPRIYPDVQDILLKPAEAFARLKSMGLPQDAPAPGGN